MILDSGIFTLFERVDVSKPGGLPTFDYRILDKGWYGELNFETAPITPTDNREDTQTSARIRVLQNRRITNHNIVVLADVLSLADGLERYDVTRAYHGVDDDNGQPITDLTLKAVEL